MEPNLRDQCPHTHSFQTLKFLQEYKGINNPVIINGSSLTIPQIYHVFKQNTHTNNESKSETVGISPECISHMTENSKFLEKLLVDGAVIYGVNTGYGGSADVRCNDFSQVQISLIRHLNAGFGDVLPSQLVRAVMLVRSNSLCKGFSGVHASVPEMIVNMLNKNVIPVVPKRGSVSASGDLMPTSYIAGAMMGCDNVKVDIGGEILSASEGLQRVGLTPIEFKAKEALAVVNAASFASSLGACVLYDANIAVMLTQACTAFSVECLRGHAESFHPTIHRFMPHPGQQEVAHNIRKLLKQSKFTIQELNINCKDKTGTLKQDRYALRSSPQWLGPVVETIQEAIRRITTEINSVNDNPIIDHEHGQVLHGANFQGSSITVAMDQTRQALQMCGKLLFGQMQEIVNSTMNNGLPPNLNGSDINTDFGFKGMDTAMASYMSELDYLANNMTNHVLSAELHNQAVNSMGLVSARMTQQALEILQMMIVNIMCAHLQAVDLRWLKLEVELILESLYKKHSLSVPDVVRLAFPWYNFAFTPNLTVRDFLKALPVNGLNTELFVSEVERGLGRLMSKVKNHKHLPEVENHLGKGIKKLYSYMRRNLKVPFYDGTSTLDSSLHVIHQSIVSHDIDLVIADMLNYIVEN